MATARSLLGVPYLHQGRTRKATDCAGVALLTARHHGLMSEADPVANYGTLPQPLLLATMKRLCMQLPTHRKGCIVLIRWHGTQDAQHVAICAGDTIIHCCGMHKRVIEHGYRAQWIAQTDSCWWIPGVQFE